MVERIRARVPGVAFRTSFIVGFPGETEADFEELLAFVKAAEFDRRRGLHLSRTRRTRRPSTWPAGCAPREGGPPAAAHAAQKGISARRNRGRVGERWRSWSRAPIPTPTSSCGAGSPRQAPEIDGEVLINDGTADPGTFVTCEVTERTRTTWWRGSSDRRDGSGPRRRGAVARSESVRDTRRAPSRRAHPDACARVDARTRAKACQGGSALVSLLFQLGVLHQSGLAPLFFLEGSEA